MNAVVLFAVWVVVRLSGRWSSALPPDFHLGELMQRLQNGRSPRGTIHERLLVLSFIILLGLLR